MIHRDIGHEGSVGQLDGADISMLLFIYYANQSQASVKGAQKVVWVWKKK